MQNLNVTKKAFKDSYVKKWCYKNSFLILFSWNLEN